MNIASSTPANTVKRDYWLPILMIVLIAVAYSPVIVISAIWEKAVQAIGGTERVSQQILTNCSHILIGGSVLFRGRG
jgi:hypothetical protein